MVEVTAKWALLPLAGIGMLMSHEATYRIAEADEGHRHGLLEATGHGWLSFAGPALLAMAVLAITLGWSLVAKKAAAPRLWQLLAVQTATFWTVEVLERAVSGHDPVPQASILLIGAAAQVPVALIVWLGFTKIVMPAFELLMLPDGTPSTPATGRAWAWAQVESLVPQTSGTRLQARAPPCYGM